MVVFCFSPPRCVPTYVVFLNFPHNASHLPTSFLYEKTHPSQSGCVFAFKHYNRTQYSQKTQTPGV